MRVGKDEFRIEGLTLPDARPLIVKTNYINLSTIVWDFPQFSSPRLKHYLTPTDDIAFGGPSRIVRYVLVGEKLAREGYISHYDENCSYSQQTLKDFHRKSKINDIDRPDIKGGRSVENKEEIIKDILEKGKIRNKSPPGILEGLLKRRDLIQPYDTFLNILEKLSKDIPLVKEVLTLAPKSYQIVKALEIFDFIYLVIS